MGKMMRIQTWSTGGNNNEDRDVTEVETEKAGAMWKTVARMVADLGDDDNDGDDKVWPVPGVPTRILRLHMRLCDEWQQFPDELARFVRPAERVDNDARPFVEQVLPYISQPESSKVLSSFLALPLADQWALGELGRFLDNEVLVVLRICQMAIIARASIDGGSCAWWPLIEAATGAEMTFAKWDAAEAQTVEQYPWLVAA